MKLLTTIIALLMVTDAAFALLNLSKIESFLLSQFPKMNVKLLAVMEGVAGLVILIVKIGTRSIS